VTAVLALDPARVHAWRMNRQLLGPTKAASPVDVAARLVGVQAQVVSSAALAIALRSRPNPTTPGVEATTRALDDRRLVRSWAMRGTLHLFAAEDVPTVAAAMVDRQSWRRPAWLRWFGATELEMEALIDTIGEVLDDGRPRTRAELAEEVGARLGPSIGRLLLGSWGAALKIASDRNYLVQSLEDGGVVRFVRASRWLASWRDEDPEEAFAALVQRYLAAYGPANLDELRRWWGVAQLSVVRPVVAALGDAVTQVDVAGERGYVLAADVEAIRATRPRRGAVQLVGGFDPLVVGAGLRAQLLPASHLKRVSRTAGWISPVVLVDGVAAGVWDADRANGGVVITVEPFAAPDAAIRSAIVAAAESVGRARGTPVTVRFGRVFEAPRRAEPFNDR
jgi:hypothetical protein